MALIDLDTSGYDWHQPQQNNSRLPGGTAGPDPNMPRPPISGMPRVPTIPRRPPPSRIPRPQFDGVAMPGPFTVNMTPGNDPDPGATLPPGGGTAPGSPNPNPTTPPTPPTGQFSLGAFRDAFTKLTAGRSGTVDDFITVVFPALQQQFPGIKRFGSKGEKIQLPDGTVIDAVIAAGVGGRGYAFQVDNGPGSFFNDPIGSWFASLVGDMIGQLGQGRDTPGQVNEAYEILKRFATGGWSAPDLGDLRNNTRRRVDELNAEPFSATEEAAQRVKAFDNLERSRAVAVQQVRERLVAQGHAPSSGTVEAAIQQVNASFDGLRAQNENSLLLNNINERQRRKSEAISIEQQLADRLLGASSIENQGRGQSISAAQALAQMAQYIGNFNDPMSRIAMILQAAGLIPAYAQQQWDNARQSSNDD